MHEPAAIGEIFRRSLVPPPATPGHVPLRIRRNCSTDRLPPLITRTTFFAASRCLSLTAAAREAAPAPSARLCVCSSSRSTAASMASSSTSTKSSRYLRMIRCVFSNGTRVASPSARVLVSAQTILPEAQLSCIAGAGADWNDDRIDLGQLLDYFEGVSSDAVNQQLLGGADKAAALRAGDAHDPL